MSQKNIVLNRRATYDYEILESFEAGIVLLGTEIKSLRANGGNLAEAYVRVIQNELWLIGSSITPYKFGAHYNHEERRDRKLLMHKKEIEKLKASAQQKGLALIPLSLYFKEGRVKVKIGLGRGKKNQDKRQTIIEREKKREMSRAMKKFR
ncbi:MAG: SsrA-binding protein [Chlamydiales bacterium]|nr:SsrA-binding protein [Chlamydiales bacterium]